MSWTKFLPERTAECINSVLWYIQSLLIKIPVNSDTWTYMVPAQPIRSAPVISKSSPIIQIVVVSYV